MGLDFENLYGRNTIGFIADPIKASTQQSKSTTAKAKSTAPMVRKSKPASEISEKPSQSHTKVPKLILESQVNKGEVVTRSRRGRQIILPERFK